MAPRGFLKTVIEYKRRDIEQARKLLPPARCRELAENGPAPLRFDEALAISRPGDAGIIAEIKKASPSKGDIRLDLDPGAYAATYTEAGARAISVLTETHFFKGSLEDLKAVRANTTLPVLRKDFTLSSYQIYEARAAGADTVLLIVSILSAEQLRDYTLLARELGMEPLVEIHSEKEFETATRCDARVIGINNRNLVTLETDLNVSRRLAPLFLSHQIPVEASGIASSDDIRHGLTAGYANFLVGESIVRAEDTKAFIRELKETLPAPETTDRSQSSRLRFLRKTRGRPLVKICGLTREDQALECAALGADAIGLVFYEKSPRNVSIGQAADICRYLPPDILTTGVFVNAPRDAVMERVEACRLKAVQFHGQESPSLVAELAGAGVIVIKALFAEKAPLLDTGSDYPMASAFLAECGKGPLPGGNRETWNWERITAMKRTKPIFVAGGLDPDNIIGVVTSVKPDGVDVSSGVELEPGIKDMEKVRAFLRRLDVNR